MNSAIKNNVKSRAKSEFKRQTSKLLNIDIVKVRQVRYKINMYLNSVHDKNAQSLKGRGLGDK